jgi:hypothetical protein
VPTTISGRVPRRRACFWTEIPFQNKWWQGGREGGRKEGRKEGRKGGKE